MTSFRVPVYRPDPPKNRTSSSDVAGRRAGFGGLGAIFGFLCSGRSIFRGDGVGELFFAWALRKSRFPTSICSAIAARSSSTLPHSPTCRAPSAAPSADSVSGIPRARTRNRRSVIGLGPHSATGSSIE